MTPNVDPAREKVERGDEILRSAQESVIDDPTVFVKGAALGALTLLELAKLALARSRDGEVRATAEQLRAGQSTLLRELSSVAGRKKLDVPRELVYDDERLLAEAPEDPAAFGVWFAVQANAELLKAQALFETATRMNDVELAAFAKRTLPKLDADRARVTTLKMV